jgi:hypothetical protein
MRAYSWLKVGFVLLSLGVMNGFAEEHRLTKDGIGPIVISTDIDVNGKDAVLHASARNDSGQVIAYARFCIQRESEKKGCDFELAKNDWNPGEEMTWKPQKGPARKGIENFRVIVTELRSEVPPAEAGQRTSTLLHPGEAAVAKSNSNPETDRTLQADRSGGEDRYVNDSVYLYVNQAVHLRSGPSSQSGLLISLEINQKVLVLSTGNGLENGENWSKVRFGNLIGYVPNSRLSVKKVNVKAPTRESSPVPAIAGGIRQTSPQAPLLSVPAVQIGPAKLMLFGGQNHKVYLGCLNCSEYAPDSIFNKFGNNGNQFSSESILNRFSEFGSRFSQYGACNPLALDPPVIVDSEGRYFGRLTLNKLHPEIGIGRQWLGWVAAICQ